MVVNGFESEYFSNVQELMQGEVLSPILFSLYMNYFEITFLRSGCIPVECLDLNLFLLMYVDSLAIFSETVVGLQTQLNSLEVYCKEWSLKINVHKTKIVIFRNGGKLYDNEKFYIINNTEIEVVNKFTYLGLCFNHNGKFTEAEKQLAMRGRKAVFALNKNINGLFLNNETLLSLFDS